MHGRCTRKGCSKLKRETLLDGDTFVTKEGFIFCAFGYEHPEGRVVSFLKYVPSEFRTLFAIEFLRNRWRFQNRELVRPVKLYTVRNLQEILKTFRHKFPDYTYYCPFYGKHIVSPTVESIGSVYVPRERLQRLLQRKRDNLQELATQLATMLSEESHVGIGDFGIRGSLALAMHTPKSDIDLAVYGGPNFRRVEKAVGKLNEENALSYVFSTKLDCFRKFRGRFKEAMFMLSAIRRTEEIRNTYGKYSYYPIRPVRFRCRVVDDSQAMFKPAVYRIGDYQPLDQTSKLTEEECPMEVVSMIGCYRNVARKGATIKVSGTLEKLESVEAGEPHHQIVVGTGVRGDEYIWPISN